MRSKSKQKAQKQHNRREQAFHKCRTIWRGKQDVKTIEQLGNILRAFANDSEYPEAYTATATFDYYNHLQDPNISKERLIDDLEYLSDRFASPERLNAMFWIVQQLITKNLEAKNV